MRILHVADLRLAAPPAPDVLAADAEAALAAVAAHCMAHDVHVLLLTGVFGSVRPSARAQAHLGRTLRRLSGAGTAVVAVAGAGDLPVGGGSGPFDVFAALAPRGAAFVQTAGVTALHTAAGEVRVAAAGIEAAGRRRSGAPPPGVHEAEVAELAAACADAEQAVLVLPGAPPDVALGDGPFAYLAVGVADGPFVEAGPPPQAYPGPAYRHGFGGTGAGPAAVLADLDAGEVRLLPLPGRPFVTVPVEVDEADPPGSVRAALSGVDLDGAVVRIELRGSALAVRTVDVRGAKAAAAERGAAAVEVRLASAPAPSVRAPRFAALADPLEALEEWLGCAGVSPAEVAALGRLAAELAEAAG